MSKLIAKFLKVVHVFIVLFYLAACLIPYLPAGKYWVIATIGLVFPILFVMLCCFFIGWMMVKSKWSLLSLIALLLGWKQVSVMFGFNLNKTFNFSKSLATVRILQWNVSSWGVSNRSQLPQTNYGALTVELIKKQQADIMCFQEYWDRRDWYSKDLNIRAFKEMGYTYSFFVKSINENGEARSGVIVLSKYPIVDTAFFSYGENDYAEHLIYADIQLPNQKVRIFTTHLQSVRFTSDEYTTIKEIKNRDKAGVKGSKSIIKKLKIAYHFREAEAELVKQKISESPYPVIICGDFNDVPNSYTYFTIRGNLKDAFLEKGNSTGRTFQYISPTLRIDYILPDPIFNVIQYNRIKVPYSDHYPIIADIELARLK